MCEMNSNAQDNMAEGSEQVWICAQTLAIYKVCHGVIQSYNEWW